MNSRTKSSNRGVDKETVISDVLFYSIGEGAIIIDERGNISRINKIGLDILGFKEKDLQGKWYPEALIAENEDGSAIPNYERPIAEAFFTGEPISKRIYYRKKDGTRIAVALNVAPLLDGDRPIGAIQLFRDITQELQLERAKDEFIAIASHQLRTPATVVKQNLGLIIEGFVTTKKEQKVLIKSAYEYNNNQLEIINDLLNVAQADANKLEPDMQMVNLVSILKKVISTQKTAYEAREMTLKLDVEKDKIVVCADQLHMQMIFDNLITNAQKYSPSKTEVTVTARTENKSAVIEIKDHGVGIYKKDIPNLFRKFSRVENVNSTAGGSGLGLYWAKKLVELHGGEITLVSRINKGTTFKVTLPLGDL